MKIKVACVVGTRPEAVKMGPVIKHLQSDLASFETIVVSTGQHGRMLSEILEFFDVVPDISLNLLSPRQSLWDLTGRACEQLGKIFSASRPDWVLVQGDTTSAFAAAYCAFLVGCKVGHVEAGLRTGRKRSPFPEEINRKLIAGVTDLHFAPTARAVEFLRHEGIAEESIRLTGNTIVDALHLGRSKLNTQVISSPNELHASVSGRKRVLVTAHRRENHQTGILNICEALKLFLSEFSDYEIVFQLHPNPAVQSIVNKVLEGHPRVMIVGPQPYGAFIRLMIDADFILTDSGGIQEEGPSLGKSVLIAREETERPEAVEAGFNKLVGTSVREILSGMRSLASHDDRSAGLSERVNPFGDGKAASRIVEILKRAGT
jgi:UDP-N-acetylglucosamine 2-epimerase (non-hydrolysing)